MTRQIISTERAPGSPLYRQGVRAGSMITVSGMVGIDPATGEVSGPSIQDQTLQALRNCEAVLNTGRATLADVALVTVLLARPSDFAGMNEVYAGFLPAPLRVRSPQDAPQPRPEPAEATRRFPTPTKALVGFR